MPRCIAPCSHTSLHTGARHVLTVCSLVLCGIAGLATPAMAQTTQSPQSSVEPMEPVLRRNEFMITAHSRAAFAPSFLLDLWFEQHANTWSEGQRNWSYGAHFTWRLKGDYELGVLVDWANLSMPAQFWKQSSEEVEEADFTTIDLQMLSVVFSTYWYWDPIEWLSPYIGVGIGAGYLAGDGINDYKPVTGSACDTDRGKGEDFTPEACYGSNGEPDPSQVDLTSKRPADRIPPVVPVLHLAGGLRFNIYKYGVVKLEVGVNDYTYVGLSLGGQWW